MSKRKDFLDKYLTNVCHEWMFFELAVRSNSTLGPLNHSNQVWAGLAEHNKYQERTQFWSRITGCHANHCVLCTTSGVSWCRVATNLSILSFPSPLPDTGLNKNPADVMPLFVHINMITHMTTDSLHLGGMSQKKVIWYLPMIVYK